MLSISWLMADSSKRTRRPALMIGGRCRATSSRSVRSATRRRIAVSENVKSAGAHSGNTKAAWYAGLADIDRFISTDDLARLSTPSTGADAPDAARARWPANR